MYAIVFPGQGSQAVGMACDLRDRHAVAREVFDEAEAAFGGGLIERIERGPDSELRRTEITQPAILTASIAAYRVFEARLPSPPALLAGHSLGEYSALVAAGALALADAVRLVRRRGALMQEAVPEGEGAMAAVLGLDTAEIARVCQGIDGPVAPANMNAPGQTVIAGSAAAVAAAGVALKEAGAKRIMPLDVSAPFHSALMKPAMEKLAPELAAAPFRDLRVPVVSNVTAKPYRTAAEARELLREQVCAPVRFVECVEAIRAQGAKLIVEVGPGRVLSAMIARIDRGLARCNVAGVDDLEPALSAVRDAA